jgi:methylase of polypeptide subunit release factors
VTLLDIAKSFFIGKVAKNGVAVDFTMGNGYDTLFLSQLVPEGQVFAFDIQKSAVDSTRERLEANGVTNVTLIHDSHANVADYVRMPISAAMFNLGYLPGGDKSVHTMTESTLVAVKAGLDLLEAGGVMTVSVYPGHDEGAREGMAVAQMLSELDRRVFSVLQCKMLNSSESPYIIAIERNKKG